jgi:hypothetical protein
LLSLRLATKRAHGCHRRQGWNLVKTNPADSGHQIRWQQGILRAADDDE